MRGGEVGGGTVIESWIASTRPKSKSNELLLHEMLWKAQIVCVKGAGIDDRILMLSPQLTCMLRTRLVNNGAVICLTSK